MLEPRADLPHLPDSAKSKASVSQRRRVCEHTEDSSSGLIDSGAETIADDDNNGGNDIGGDSLEVPMSELDGLLPRV